MAFKMRFARCGCGFLMVLALAALLFEYFWLRHATRFVEAQESDAILTGGAYQMKQLEKRIGRFGWSHDVSFPVAFYGDEHWMELLMPYVDRRDYLDCGGNHKDMAMSYITCHAPPQRNAPVNVSTNSTIYAKFADLHPADWKQWWLQNKDKRQWQWVQAGLAQWGLQVERPVTSQNIHDILLALGRQKLFAQQQSAKRLTAKKSEKVSPPEILVDEIKRDEILPDFVLYNASRWLKDFGGLNGIVDSRTLIDLDARTRLMVKLGIAAYEEQRTQGIRTRPSLDEGQQYSDEDLDRELWTEHDFVRAERILIPTAVVLLLVSTSALACGSVDIATISDIQLLPSAVAVRLSDADEHTRA